MNKLFLLIFLSGCIHNKPITIDQITITITPTDTCHHKDGEPPII